MSDTTSTIVLDIAVIQMEAIIDKYNEQFPRPKT